MSGGQLRTPVAGSAGAASGLADREAMTKAIQMLELAGEFIDSAIQREALQGGLHDDEKRLVSVRSEIRRVVTLIRSELS